MITRMHSIAISAGLTLGLALSSVALAEGPGLSVSEVRHAQTNRPGIDLGLVSASAMRFERPGFDAQDLQPAQVKLSEKWVRPPSATEPDSGGEHRYIVQFEDEALPLYELSLIHI